MVPIFSCLMDMQFSRKAGQFTNKEVYNYFKVKFVCFGFVMDIHMRMEHGKHTVFLIIIHLPAVS